MIPELLMISDFDIKFVEYTDNLIYIFFCFNYRSCKLDMECENHASVLGLFVSS